MDANDRARIASGLVDVPCEGGTAPAFFAAPRAAGPETPAVVVAMHLWGLDRAMRTAAERFAEAGFVAVVPDLYAHAGLDAPAGDGANEPAAFVPFARALTTDGIDAAFEAAARWLRGRHPAAKVGLAGFCMGGRMATARATAMSPTFAAIASWYGLADIEAREVDVPLVASFGADDRGIPAERVRAFESGLLVAHDIKRYRGAGHAFADEQREAFEPRASEDSWRRTLDFLALHL